MKRKTVGISIKTAYGLHRMCDSSNERKDAKIVNTSEITTATIVNAVENCIQFYAIRGVFL